MRAATIHSWPYYRVLFIAQLHPSTMVLGLGSCEASEGFQALLQPQDSSSFTFSFLRLLWHSFWCFILSSPSGNLAPTTEECPGYVATNVQSTTFGLTADLSLSGAPCNIYGNDLKHLRFKAEYQTGTS